MNCKSNTPKELGEMSESMPAWVTLGIAEFELFQIYIVSNHENYLSISQF